MSGVKQWVPEDQVNEFKSVTRSQLDKHWAGVINTDDSSLSQISTPVTLLRHHDTRTN